MKIGVSVPIDLLKEKYLSSILQHKILVEIVIKAEHLDGWERKTFRELARILKEEKIELTVHLPFMDLSLAALDSWIRRISLKRLFQALEVAALFNPFYCVFHSGYHPDYHREPKELWRRIFIEESLPEILELAKSLELKLLLENVFEPLPEFVEPIYVSFKEELGWCFDPAHARVFSEREELFWLQKLYPYLKEIHSHDNFGKWDDHLAVGKGILKFPEILSFLKEKNLNPLFIIEARGEEEVLFSLNYLKDLCESFKKEKERPDSGDL